MYRLTWTLLKPKIKAFVKYNLFCGEPSAVVAEVYSSFNLFNKSDSGEKKNNSRIFPTEMSVEIPLTSYVERGYSHLFHLLTLPHPKPHPPAHAHSSRTAAKADVRAARLFKINLREDGGKKWPIEPL